MDKLTAELYSLVEKLADSKTFKEDIEKLRSVYPFSKYEFIISTLLSIPI